MTEIKKEDALVQIPDPERITSIKYAINTGDAELVRIKLEEALATLKDNPEVINWIITPANITFLQKELVTKFNVPPRAMMLRNRTPARGKRASLFIRAMLNGLKKSSPIIK